MNYTDLVVHTVVVSYTGCCTYIDHTGYSRSVQLRMIQCVSVIVVALYCVCSTTRLSTKFNH